MEQGRITFTLKGLGSIPKSYHHDYGFFMVSSLSLQTNEKIHHSYKGPEWMSLSISGQHTNYHIHLCICMDKCWILITEKLRN